MFFPECQSGKQIADSGTPWKQISWGDWSDKAAAHGIRSIANVTTVVRLRKL
jgi:hypothetical protein